MASCSGGAVQGQIVLVLQGGGALGAYQVGVYQALHAAGLEPDWVIGTSIGAINGALIAGNTAENRMARLHEFWRRVEQTAPFAAASIFLRGIQPFFVPLLLLLSAAKFALVAMFYMHLKQDSKLFTGVFVFPLIIAAIIVVALMLLMAYHFAFARSGG